MNKQARIATILLLLFFGVVLTSLTGCPGAGEDVCVSPTADPFEGVSGYSTFPGTAAKQADDGRIAIPFYRLEEGTTNRYELSLRIWTGKTWVTQSFAHDVVSFSASNAPVIAHDGARWKVAATLKFTDAASKAIKTYFSEEQADGSFSELKPVHDDNVDFRVVGDSMGAASDGTLGLVTYTGASAVRFWFTEWKAGTVTPTTSEIQVSGLSLSGFPLWVGYAADLTPVVAWYDDASPGHIRFLTRAGSTWTNHGLVTFGATQVFAPSSFAMAMGAGDLLIYSYAATPDETHLEVFGGTLDLDRLGQKRPKDPILGTITVDPSDDTNLLYSKVALDLSRSNGLLVSTWIPGGQAYVSSFDLTNDFGSGVPFAPQQEFYKAGAPIANACGEAGFQVISPVVVPGGSTELNPITLLPLSP